MATRVMYIAKILLLGVSLGLVLSDQSDFAESSDEQPTAGQGKGRLDTPEVVLQLKYDGGELNKIYLAQFRKGKEVWSPSVPARSDLCTDLCHAGLGGEACGPACHAMIPVGLQHALNNYTSLSSELIASEQVYGEPRVNVCPVLCNNQLGYPLCTCAEIESEQVNWGAICEAFCHADNYVLRGCPNCDPSSLSPLHVTEFQSSRTLSTSEGWAAWCNAQCRQGHGGAACNCDRAPM